LVTVEWLVLNNKSKRKYKIIIQRFNVLTFCTFYDIYITWEEKKKNIISFIKQLT